MPLIEVHLADGRTDDQKRALLEGITAVVRDTIGAPLESIRVWIHEFPPTDYMAAGEWLVDTRARAARPGAEPGPAVR